MFKLGQRPGDGFLLRAVMDAVGRDDEDPFDVYSLGDDYGSFTGISNGMSLQVPDVSTARRASAGSAARPWTLKGGIDRRACIESKGAKARRFRWVTGGQRVRDAVRMRDLVRQLEDVARLLDDVGSLPPLSVTFTHDRDEGPYVILETPHQLPLADQRLAVDQIAARVHAVPKVGEVLSGRYGASARGQWDDTTVVAVTNAAPHIPGMPTLPERTTTTRETADALRALTAWVGTTEAHMDELVVSGHSRSHTVHAFTEDDDAAQNLLEGLIPDTDSRAHRPGRRYRALLPTGHSLTVTVAPAR